MAGEIINRLNVGQVVNVKLTDSAVTNGQNLVEAYNYAKTLTPNGAALSATNRVAVILQPGNYSLSAELAINTQFIDIIGLGAQKLERGSIPAVNITNNTLNVTANDVRVQGISVGTQAFKMGNNLPLQRFEDCTGGDYSWTLAVASGTFVNCIGGLDAFGGLNTASGTFINCTGTGNNAFGGASGTASGIFINCTANSGSSFGGILGTSSGTFTNCIGSESAFAGGFGGTCSGTYTNCIADASSFGSGGTLTGKLYQCRITSGTFETVTGGGLMRNCIDGNNNIVDQ
jgi:hypothetical protein